MSDPTLPDTDGNGVTDDMEDPGGQAYAGADFGTLAFTNVGGSGFMAGSVGAGRQS